MKFQLWLAEHGWGRVALHLICLARIHRRQRHNSHEVYHLGGISRELGVFTKSVGKATS